MKEFVVKKGIVILALLSFLRSSAYDFKVDGIYYNVLSLSDLTCEVTYNESNKSTTALGYYTQSGSSYYPSPSLSYPSYSGKVTVPATVTYKGRELTVVRIGAYAFLNCTNLTSLALPSSITSIAQIQLTETCYAGAFDFCNIQTFTAGNAYCLQMFNQSYAFSSGYTRIEGQTKDHLKHLILSSDFEGTINVNFNKYTKLESLISLANEVPNYSRGTHYTNDQYLNMEVLVPEDAFTKYQTSEIWKDFWELTAMKSVKSLSLNETALSLEPKQKIQLSVSVTPEDAYDSSVTWSSSNPSVATVSQKGLVSAITKGDTQIVVSANDGSGVKAECSIHVDLLVKDIQLSEAEIGLELRESKQLAVEISPKDAYIQDVIWTSDDENIATVDNHGKVTAHNIGVTNISATTTDGSNLTATCNVTVVNPVKSITVAPTTATIKESETTQLSATVYPENATYQEVVWSSEDTNIASVDANGVVTAISAGTVTIKATASDGSGIYGQCEITVTAETIESNGICYQRNSLTTLRIVPNPDSPYSGDFIIPENARFNGTEMTITEIGEKAFYKCNNLTSIIIPNTITKIRESAFKGCKKLTFVKICDGSQIEANLDVVFANSPISELYIGSNAVSYNPESRLLSIVKSMILGGSVSNLPPKDVFTSLNSFIVEDGENPIVETDDYCTGSTKLISQQTLKDPYTYIYYRFFYMVTYTHLSPILNAIQNSTLNYLHIGRAVQQVERDTSKTYEIIPTTAGSRYQEYGYMDEVNYQYQDLIVKSDYNRNPVESVVINKSVVELNVGESVKLSAICTPTNASLTAVNWSSSNENIAIVDIFGNVTKVTEGEAIITAATTDGTNLTTTCKIVNPGAGAEDIIMSSENGIYIVYNLQGIMVLKTEDYEQVNELPAGLYLVNGNKVIVR